MLLCLWTAEGEWKLIVRTSDFAGAGTNARVFVTFYGLKSCSEKLELMNEDSKPFQQGKQSTFLVTCLSISDKIDFISSILPPVFSICSIPLGPMLIIIIFNISIIFASILHKLYFYLNIKVVTMLIWLLSSMWHVYSPRRQSRTVEWICT